MTHREAIERRMDSADLTACEGRLILLRRRAGFAIHYCGSCRSVLRIVFGLVVSVRWRGPRPVTGRASLLRVEPIADLRYGQEGVEDGSGAV